MRMNGMCPICYIKKLFTRPSRVSEVVTQKNHNGVALTPPMGWSSWNTFKNQINQEVILETAVAMKEKGLAEAGYTYINLDDNWHSSMRDINGELQPDLVRFSRGIPDLVSKINSLGLKVGIYSSNGTHTCEDLPASLYNEQRDACTFAKWGIEYFKYDFCHNEKISKYAPLVYSISIAKVGESKETEYFCNEAKVIGTAKKMNSKQLTNGMYISGLDNCTGMAIFDIAVDSEGEYILNINIKKSGSMYEKAVIAEINGTERVIYYIPKQQEWNVTARFQQKVTLIKGKNTIKLFNPIHTNADSARLQYINMGKMLNNAAAKVAREQGKDIKPILFSICEWGVNEPHKWGSEAGNCWRTTRDIMPQWWRIMQIYEHNVKLHEYASVGGWNDPDMLEVGNGSLTHNENVAHFSLWCMMNAPLILGNDLRNITNEVIDIVTNSAMIAINQDRLGKQAKRFKAGNIDVLIKPLVNEEVALCIFNKASVTAWYDIKIDSIMYDEYINIKKRKEYYLQEVWAGTTDVIDSSICGNIDGHSVKVYRIKKYKEQAK